MTDDESRTEEQNLPCRDDAAIVEYPINCLLLKLD